MEKLIEEVASLDAVCARKLLGFAEQFDESSLMRVLKELKASTDPV